MKPEDGHRAETWREYQQRVLRVMVAIEHNPDQDLSLGALAAFAHLSPFHFQRVFRAVAGEGPGEYVRRLRLERAASDLIWSGARLSTISRGAGYARPESFTRAFAERFGVLPSVWREGRAARARRIRRARRRGRSWGG